MKTYRLSREQEDILEISSALENAPYLLGGGQSLTYVGSGKSGTCNCASSNSSGGTCRALSLETSVSE